MNQDPWSGVRGADRQLAGGSSPVRAMNRPALNPKPKLSVFGGLLRIIAAALTVALVLWWLR